MQKIAIFGKGGIGKSTFSSNLAAAYARRGLRVLLVGCDPKHDTTLALTEGAPIRTAVEHSAFMDSGGGSAEGLVVRGRLGVDCVEAGGPEPGIGCAGRGISRMIEILEEAGFLRGDRYDVALFDVLGDVVCGGFAAPLREGMADKVVIVTSEELMSLYAANNVARAVRNYSANGSSLIGLAANLRDPDADREAVSRFAALIGTRVLGWLTRDAAVRRAEYARTTAVESAPSSDFARRVEALAGELLAAPAAPPPSPLGDERFAALSRRAFRDDGAAPAAPARTKKAPLARKTLAARPAPAADGGTELEDALRAEASVPREAGESAAQWGANDQWRLFFCDRESRRNERAGLELQAPVLQVWHQDLECSYAGPQWDLREPSFFRFPWLRRGAEGPREEGGEHGENARMPQPRMTDLRDQDVIGGGEAKLREALEEGLAGSPEIEAVVVQSTCVPTVIGDDVPKTLRRFAATAGVPLIDSNAAANRRVDAGRLILERLRAEPGYGKEPVVPGSVNLVGFPEGEAMSELCALLERSGVGINARAMPRLDLAAARRLPRAAAQVFLPHAAYEAVYAAVFRSLPAAAHEFPAPFGVEGSRRWLSSVAGLFGRAAEAEAAFDEAFAARRERWDERRSQAAGRRLAFVADRESLPRLSDARLFWGVPVLRVLREMGFRVEVLLYGAADRGPLKGFKTPEELAARLADGRYDAVYSEYAFDERLVKAGTAAFSLADFEPGPGGAVASIERLLAAGRWGFYRRYAAALSPEGA